MKRLLMALCVALGGVTLFLLALICFNTPMPIMLNLAIGLMLTVAAALALLLVFDILEK